MYGHACTELKPWRAMLRCHHDQACVCIYMHMFGRGGSLHGRPVSQIYAPNNGRDPAIRDSPHWLCSHRNCGISYSLSACLITHSRVAFRCMLPMCRAVERLDNRAPFGAHGDFGGAAFSCTVHVA
eukprot:jgi/Botrbrau1/16069/Bobra.7_2s0040.1